MIYHLIQFLSKFDIPGEALFTHLSSRAIMASIASLLIAWLAGKRIIRWLQKKQIGETIRDLGLEGQMQKKGTPTMGGIIIILAVAVSALLFCDLTSIYSQLLLFTLFWCGAMGFADDYIKVFRKNKEGMSERWKLILQGILGLVVALTVCYSPDIVVREKVMDEDSTIYVRDAGDSLCVNSEKIVSSGQWKDENVVKSTKTTIPFVKSHEFDYAMLSPFKGALGWYFKWAIYMLMIIIVITACTNGANLTDGMDGLSAGTSAIVAVVLGIFAWLSGNLVNSDYLNIMYIPGTGEIAVFMSAFLGALLGFLWHNAFPAQVFMGDTGSLTIGGIIGVCAVLIRKELLMPLLCGIFLMESLSVILQRGYFKYTKRRYGEGRRIFRMAPLHHHFQKTGIPALLGRPANAIPEAKIVTRFWIIGLLLAVATLAMLKLR